MLSWEPTKNLTVGGGVSWQHAKATLTRKANYAAGFAQGVGAAVAGGLVPAAVATPGHHEVSDPGRLADDGNCGQGLGFAK